MDTSRQPVGGFLFAGAAIAEQPQRDGYVPNTKAGLGA